MFFQAFDPPEEPERLPIGLIFTIENNVTQILVGCDRAFLQTACDTGTLIDSILIELDFFAFYGREKRPYVGAYLFAHKDALHATARKIVSWPVDDPELDMLAFPVCMLTHMQKSP